MKRRNKFFLTLVLAFIVLATFAFVGCKGCKDPDDNGDDAATVYFTEAGYSLEKYANLKLDAHYTGSDAVWASSNESVATVHGGIILALDIGSTEISVTVGEETAKCTVTVKATANYPALVLSQTEVEVLKTKTKTVVAELKVSGSEILSKDFVSYEYKSEDTTIASVSQEGVITGVGIGKTNVIVSAKYANKTITEKIAVDVKENVEILFKKSSEILYTNSIEGKYDTQKNIEVFVYENDQLVNNPNVTWTTDNGSVISVDGGLVKALDAGEATVKATYTTASSNAIETSMKITVEYPEIETEFDLTVELFSSDLTFDLSEYSTMFDSSMREVYIVDDLGSEISATIDGGVVTVDNQTVNYGFREFTVRVNNEVEFLIGVEAITKIIRTPAELKNFAVEYGGREPINGNDSTGNYSGYFVLGNDIDMNGEKINYWCGHGAIYAIDNVYNGFKGIFDGKGHTIYNAGSNIFGKVSIDGVIKNLGVYSGVISEYGAIAAILSGKVENCYVKTNLTAQKPNTGSICYRAIGSVNFTNVIVDVTDYDKMSWFNKGTENERFLDGHVGTFVYSAGSAPEVSNVFVISPSKEDILCASGSFKGTITHFGRAEDKSFATFITSSGYWTKDKSVMVFKSSLGWDLTKLATVDKTSFEYFDGDLSWDAVANANGYEVVVNGKAITTLTNRLDDVPNAARVMVRALGDKVNYRDGEFSAEYTCINLSENSLAGFDHEIYEQLVEPDKSTGITALQYCPENLDVEYLESYKGETGVIKVTAMMNKTAYGSAGYFIVNLPKAATGNKITVKMMVMDAPAGFKLRNIGSISGDNAYIGGTSGQYAGDHTIQYTSGAWLYLVIDISEQRYAGKDKIEFALWGGNDVAYKSYTIYFGEVYDGEYSLQAELAVGLTGNALADYSSESYESMITANPNSKAGAITTEYLESYQGENGVLKVTVKPNATQWWSSGFVINLVKATTSGKVTVRMMKDLSVPGFKVQNADTGADLVNLTYELANTTLNQWIDVTIDLSTQTSKDRIAIHGWEGAEPATDKVYTYYFAIVCDGTTIS